MAEVKPMTTTDIDTAGGAARPAGTAAPRSPAPSPADAEADAKARAAKQYEMRKTMDPLLYERVAAFHPHAATSDAAMDAFKADYDRLEKEQADAKAKADAAADAAKATEPAKPAP